MKRAATVSDLEAGLGALDEVSGAGIARSGLERALEALREGDSLVVWRLDRLGRSLRDLIELVGGLEQRKVGFRSLQESMDTSSSGGGLIFHVFGALAEFERNLIRERTVKWYAQPLLH